MPGTYFYRQIVMKNADYLATVEVAMMLAANAVLTEDPATPNHEQRAGVARALFQGLPEDIARFRRLFAYRALFDPTVAGQVFNATTNTVTAQNVDDAALDAAVASFWDVAANVTAARTP